MKTLTYDELKDLVANKPGTVITGALVEVDARARKTGNPYPEKKILKRYRISLLSGADYKRMVERHFGVAGFSVGELPPGREWVVPGKVLRFTKRDVLGLRTCSSPAMRHVPVKVTYLTVDGEEIPREDALRFVPEKTFSAKQWAFAPGKHQGEEADTQVWVRDFGFDSIKEITLGGERYKLVP